LKFKAVESFELSGTTHPKT